MGEMSKRFALESASVTADGGGGGTTAWALVAEVWGALRPMSGGERIEADGLRTRITHELWIRHREGVLPGMRFRLGPRTFLIGAVFDAAERQRFLRCLVEERQPEPTTA